MVLTVEVFFSQLELAFSGFHRGDRSGHSQRLPDLEDKDGEHQFLGDSSDIGHDFKRDKLGKFFEGYCYMAMNVYYGVLCYMGNMPC